MKAKDGECLSCLEAAEDGMCCNTCKALKDAYFDARISYYHILDTAPQCKNVVGCNVYGDVEVSKVAGNMHIALGKSDILNGVIIGTIPNKKNAFWGPFFAHIFRHYQGKIKAI